MKAKLCFSFEGYWCIQNKLPLTDLFIHINIREHSTKNITLLWNPISFTVTAMQKRKTILPQPANHHTSGENKGLQWDDERKRIPFKNHINTFTLVWGFPVTMNWCYFQLNSSVHHTHLSQTGSCRFRIEISSMDTSRAAADWKITVTLFMRNREFMIIVT